MAERVQQIAELASKGLTDAQIADRTGSTHAAVCRMRLRHNIPPGVPPGRTAADRPAPSPRSSEPQPVPALTYDEEAQALCSQADPDAWFPEQGRDARPAKRICNGDPRNGVAPCPIRARCLEVALARQEPHGIYGGMTPSERRRLSGRAVA
jgi:WhiB family redox-sensing transcriptional regulator